MRSDRHPEDVKAAIRKRFGSLTAFERAKELPHESVSDHLRGRISRRVREVIEAFLEEAAPAPQSGKPDDSAASTRAHRLNEGAL